MLNKQLLSLERRGFTGRLEIKSIEGTEWQLYFLHGRLFWGDGGEQVNRFWKCHLSQYNLDRDTYSKFFDSTKELKCSNYHWLTKLLEREQIALEQLISSISQQIERIFFEILQLEQNGQTLNYKSYSESGDSIVGCCGLKISLTRLNVEKELRIAKEKWLAWCDRGLSNISPNLAPIVRKPERLQKRVSKQVYQNFVKMLDGKQTLQELAIELKRDLLELTYSLKSYINQGSIELIKITDLSKEEIINNSNTDKNNICADKKPLIACIDDSPTMMKILEKIIRHQGYNFIGISDPLQAIPTLVIANPDLIFLDIAMPVINGYELCAQLHRVEKLQNIPMVMVTSQDGIVDRIRARISGACGFISKPIDIGQILATTEKLLNLDRPCQIPNPEKIVKTTSDRISTPMLVKK